MQMHVPDKQGLTFSPLRACRVSGRTNGRRCGARSLAQRQTQGSNSPVSASPPPIQGSGLLSGPERILKASLPLWIPSQLNSTASSTDRNPLPAPAMVCYGRYGRIKSNRLHYSRGVVTTPPERRRCSRLGAAVNLSRLATGD